jgi:predicted histone-like DNA-binding protein
MSVKFRSIPRKNPLDLAQPEKFYGIAIGDGDTDLARLAELISYQCTVTEADCYAVLLSLEHNIINELAQGRIVKLAHLGHFQVSISTEGKLNPQDVIAASITRNRILFRPGKKLRNLLKTVSYHKVS